MQIGPAVRCLRKQRPDAGPVEMPLCFHLEHVAGAADAGVYMMVAEPVVVDTPDGTLTIRPELEAGLFDDLA